MIIDFLKSFFNNKLSERPEEGKTLDHGLRVVTCALLLEMAKVDGEFSEEEKEGILFLLTKDFKLSEKDAMELMSISRGDMMSSKNLDRYADVISRNHTHEEKIRISEMVWEVAYSDGVIDKREDYLGKRLLKLLRVSQKDIMASRLKVIRRHEKFT